MGANLSKAMGSTFDRFSKYRLTLYCAGKIFGNKEMRLLMLGLDAAGKTSESIFPRCDPFLDCPSSNSLQTQAESICDDDTYRCVPKRS